MKLSIIVPIYNTEKYIRTCIESLINQTYRDIEIVLVDDGSPDTCPIICDEYAKELENVRLNGSEYTRSLRKQAQDLAQQIRDVQKKIAALTLYLEDTSEDDANALKAAQEQQADLMRQLGDIQGFIDKLEEIKRKRG